MRIDGRVVVVTGAASGIGLATAKAFSAHGARVVAADVNAAGLDAAPLAAGTDRRAVDVSDARAMQRLADAIAAKHGAVHVLVNNAGLTCIGTFEEHSDADFRRVIDVNLMGVVNGCRAFLPALRAADEARIVNVCSLFGVVGVPVQSAYCTSKFAVRGFTDALAEELRYTRVGVSLVFPGTIATNLVAGARRAEGAPDDAGFTHRSLRFFEKFGHEPAAVGERIVRAVVRREARVLVTPEMHGADALRRLWPVRGNRLFVALMRRLMGLDKAALALRVRRDGASA